MSWINLFRSTRKPSASVAKERLQVIVAHQRGQRAGRLDSFPGLQQELLQVIRKYVAVGDDAVSMEVERDGDMEVLELNIVLPDPDQTELRAHD
jgi:cell division topological specificity factor